MVFEVVEEPFELIKPRDDLSWRTVEDVISEAVTPLQERIQILETKLQKLLDLINIKLENM
ncbi:MAG: hypothetical protein ACREAU_05260 [Nitrosopumilaceae archaeon]